jgi:hypothetical protein
MRWLSGLGILGAVMVGAAASPVAASAATRARVGDAVASVDGNVATIADAAIARRWRAPVGGGSVTSSLTDSRAGNEWSTSGSPDFSLTINDLATTSTSGWSLISVAPRTTAPDPSRPEAGSGVELVFRYRYTRVVGLPLELERVYTLYPGMAVIAASTQLTNGGAVPVRVSAYSLDQLTSAAPVRSEVVTLHGGSDWRDDNRITTYPAGAFDLEGEVARFDNGRGAGWYFVAERRSGLMSRVGRDPSGRTWAGVDHGRDAFDYGPLQDQPPDYNRQNNPAYPVPVRERSIPAGASLFLGRAYVGVYSGGAQAAGATFAADFLAHSMPAFARTVGLNSFHPWAHGTLMSDANLRHQVDAARALGVETFMLDDSWQGSSSGDWRFDSGRFPDRNRNGIPDFVEYLHASGMKLGLWMSPLEFNQASQTYAGHPDWACAPTGDVTAHLPDDAGLGVWDVTNPAFRAYLLSVVDRLIARYGVTEFKFDFMAWVDCPPHDYLDYEAGFVSLVRAMEARHPGVTFQIDETNDQRTWPFESAALGPSWFDNGHLHGSTAPARLLHDIWSAAPWLPPASIGFGTYDGTLAPPYTVDYLFPISLLGHVTFWTDLTKLSRPDAAETRWWIRWYKRNRSTVAGPVYENLDRDPVDGRSWAAFQPWSRGRGFLFAFRQAGGPGRQSISIAGVLPHRTYRVSDVRTGRQLGYFSGRSLARGLVVALARPYAGRVLAIDPARAGGRPSAPARRTPRHRRSRPRARHRHPVRPDDPI